MICNQGKENAVQIYPQLIFHIRYRMRSRSIRCNPIRNFIIKQRVTNNQDKKQHHRNHERNSKLLTNPILTIILLMHRASNQCNPDSIHNN